MNADNTYKKFAQYYDLYVGDFEKDLDFYKSYCKAYEKILEVGCGTGRVLKSFLEDGFNLTGIDISQDMLEVAKEKLHSFYQHGALRLKQHNFMDRPVPEKYDKVLVTFYTFNYILEKPESFLKNIFLSMSEDALLVMDVFYPKTLANKELDNVWTTPEFRVHDRVIHLKDKRTFSNDIEERIQIYEENGEETRIQSIRKYYPPSALKRVLETVGFQNILFSKNYDVLSFKETIHEEKISGNFLVKAVKRT
jgi:ubiquinone/menaquinone biosynthesis C-methylase UbiE